MTQPTKDQIERLAFAKYLLYQAKIHHSKAFPLSSFSVLILHDLVEMFLQVAGELYTPNLTKPDRKILETLGDNLNKVLVNNGQAPIPVQFLKRLNNLRNPLKHNSIFADQSIIKNIYVESEIFFSDYSISLFGLTTDQLSLTGLIMNEKIKLHLGLAEKHLADGKYSHAMVEIAKSYHYLEHTELVVSDGSYGNLLSKVNFTPYEREYAIHEKTMGRNDNRDNRVMRLAKDVGADVGKIYQRIFSLERSLSLGSDYKSFVEFRKQLPHIYIPSTRDTDRELHFWNVDEASISKLSYSGEIAKFCFDFMIDSTFKVESND